MTINKKKKIMAVFGTRPEAIKMAPVVKELKNRNTLKVISTVTAQHREMLDQVLTLFNIKPEYDLDIMDKIQSLEQITARCVENLKGIFRKENPDIVLVQGDTTTTLGAALTAYYNKIPVGHIEAGLRTYDKYNPFPEEINRKLTDGLSEYFFAPTAGNKDNLIKENCKPENIYVTGNTVIDSLKMITGKKIVPKNKLLRRIPKDKKMVLVTSHRRENWGGPMKNIFSGLRRLAIQKSDILFIYPVHLNPEIKKLSLQYFKNIKNFKLISPVSYSDMAWLLKRCYYCFTDSGGIQEEAPSLGKPVLVLREVTERPEAVTSGTVKIIGTSGDSVYHWGRKLIEEKDVYSKIAEAVNPYGDGKASKRIADILEHRLGLEKERPVQWNKT